MIIINYMIFLNAKNYNLKRTICQFIWLLRYCSPNGPCVRRVLCSSEILKLVDEWINIKSFTLIRWFVKIIGNIWNLFRHSTSSELHLICFIVHWRVAWYSDQRLYNAFISGLFIVWLFFNIISVVSGYIWIYHL